MIDLTQFDGHTPGPWDYTKGTVTRRPVGIYGYEDNDPEVELCDHAVMVPEWPAAEQDANARLIAAAPELLEEVKRLHKAMHDIMEIATKENDRDSG